MVPLKAAGLRGVAPRTPVGTRGQSLPDDGTRVASHDPKGNREQSPPVRKRCCSSGLGVHVPAGLGSGMKNRQQGPGRRLREMLTARIGQGPWMRRP